MKLECTPQEYVAELERQSAQALALAGGLSDAALNWQPNRGKAWSVAQCLDHLAIMNRMYVKALPGAIDSNRDQLEPRKGPMQASGRLTRLFVSYEEPPPKIKLPGAKKNCAAVTTHRRGAQRVPGVAATAGRLRACVGRGRPRRPAPARSAVSPAPHRRYRIIDRVRAQPAAFVAGGECEEKCGVPG